MLMVARGEIEVEDKSLNALTEPDDVNPNETKK